MISPDKKTTGAWLVHHSNKLQNIAGDIDFQDIDFAGKCGVLLSALAADTQTVLNNAAVEAIAKASRLNVHTELPAILKKLKDHYLLDYSTQGVETLGLTTEKVLSQTTDIFLSTAPSSGQIATICIAEETSRTPLMDKDLMLKVSDTFKLSGDDTSSLLEKCSEIGFVDTQNLDQSQKIYFNGNLFRVDNAKKCEAILRSLSLTDQANITNLESVLLSKGCLEIGEAYHILGVPLFDKLQIIGVFDVSHVSNDIETTYYVTRPGAFGKFGNTIAADALDLAKALVASLTYGMTKSSHGRGRITLLNFLLDKLIRGEWLNPNTAAGQDYKYLEMKRVVETFFVGGSKYQMKLLKTDVGRLAKKILNSGDASEDSLVIPGGPATRYVGPEVNRVAKRKIVAGLDAKTTAILLNNIRTGGLS